jgi:hypothetical protein
MKKPLHATNAERASIASRKRVRPNRNAQVGIFWWHGSQLLATSCALDHGQAAGDWIDSHQEHITVWRALQRQSPSLRSIE